jgi:hypothetical protein
MPASIDLQGFRKISDHVQPRSSRGFPRQDFREVLLKTILFDIQHCLPASLPRPVHMARIVIDEQNSLRFCFHGFCHVVKQTGVPFSLAEAITAEDINDNPEVV